MLCNTSARYRGFLILVFGVVGFVVGMKSLGGPDLGWHLAGGLWMLENGVLPVGDPFGSEGNYWWCYSWLAEVLFAVAYHIGEFQGVRLLQAVLCSLFCISAAVIFTGALCVSKERKNAFELILDVTALGVVIVFCGPILYLRPQLFSLILFVVCLGLAEKERLGVTEIFLIGVVWANLHIFWVFLPLIVGCYGVGCWRDRPLRILAARVFVAVLVGFLTPYGLAFIDGFGVYLTGHDAVYLTVFEARPLSPAVGYVFWMSILTALLVLAFFRSAWCRCPGAFLLSLVFLGASLMQIRFIPFFGVVAGLVLRQAVFPLLMKRFEGRISVIEHEENFRQKVIRALLALSFAAVSFVFLLEEPVLLERRESAICSARRLSRMLKEERGAQGRHLSVLNHFNDGGWLELGFWLAREGKEEESCCRASIDGRTLVVSSTRFREFLELEKVGEHWCAIVRSWGVEAALLPKTMGLAKLWSSRTQSEERCGDWKLRFEEGPFAVFIRNTKSLPRES